MKKMSLVLSLAGLILFSACSEDDPTPGLSGTVSYNGNSYEISNGIFVADTKENDAEGKFFLSDGDLTLSESSTTVSTSNSSIVIALTVIQSDESNLSAGTYPTSTQSADGKSASLGVTLITTDPETGNLTDETKRAFVGGEITLSSGGSTNDITFDDIPFGQGVTLSGTIKGTYESF